MNKLGCGSLYKWSICASSAYGIAEIGTSSRFRKFSQSERDSEQVLRFERRKLQMNHWVDQETYFATASHHTSWTLSNCFLRLWTNKFTVFSTFAWYYLVWVHPWIVKKRNSCLGWTSNPTTKLQLLWQFWRKNQIYHNFGRKISACKVHFLNSRLNKFLANQGDVSDFTRIKLNGGRDMEADWTIIWWQTKFGAGFLFKETTWTNITPKPP